MKITEKKQRTEYCFTESYDLCDMCACMHEVPAGMLILYLLYKTEGFDSVRLSADSESDIGEERNILFVENEELEKIFESLETISDLFLRKELVRWDMKGVFHNEEISFFGNTYGTGVTVISPLSSKLNLIPLMNRIENETYEYHEYPKKLIENLKTRFQMNQKMAVISMVKLQNYPDIRDEFISGLSAEPFEFPKTNPITVEGYTAESLFQQYGLSELGAYNYLIYLRENPAEAKDALKRGLPRK